jgi:hypothetical protein
MRGIARFRSLAARIPSHFPVKPSTLHCGKDDNAPCPPRKARRFAIADYFSNPISRRKVVWIGLPCDMAAP